MKKVLFIFVLNFIFVFSTSAIADSSSWADCKAESDRENLAIEAEMNAIFQLKDTGMIQERSSELGARMDRWKINKNKCYKMKLQEIDNTIKDIKEIEANFPK